MARQSESKNDSEILGKSSRVSESDLRSLIVDEIGSLIKDSSQDSNQSKSFKLIQINSYCGKTGVGEFNQDTNLQIDEYVSKANLVSGNHRYKKG